MIRASRTRWGGVAEDAKRATGFFRTERIDGIWWLIDPDGGRFLSKGVNTVCFDQDQVQNTDRIPYAEACERKFGNRGVWRAAAARRLLSWGFNSLGCWSDGEVANAGSSPLATTPIVDVGAMFISEQGKTFQMLSYDAFPDVFNPDFDLFVRGAATTHISPRRNDPNIIGWFTDNELRWGPDWRDRNELLTTFLNYPAAMPGRRMAATMLEERYRDFDSFKAVWNTPAHSWDHFRQLASHEQPFGQAQDRGMKNSLDDDKRLAFEADCEAFAAAAADRYFEVTVAAVKAAAPKHLALGCRFAIAPRRAVIEAASRHLDVITFNCYDQAPARVLDAYASTGKPLLIGEFSFRGDDSGLPNTNGAGPRVPTQADRARGFERYASVGLRHPKLVGYHWFEHADQPVEGRFDGENSNFGTVTIADDEYEILTQAMTALNEKAEEIHAQAIPHRE
jgi:agarase